MRYPVDDNAEEELAEMERRLMAGETLNPSPELDALAAEVLARVEKQVPESSEQWARRLAEDLAKFTD